MSMCRVISCIVGRGCLLWPMHSLGKTLLAFALLHFVFQGQTCLLLQVSLDFLLLHSNPLWWKRHLFFFFFFLVLVLGLVGLLRTIQLQVFKHSWWGHRLGLLHSNWILHSIEWLALETDRDHSGFFLWLYPSTAFWTLLLTMKATPFLLRDSCLRRVKLSEIKMKVFMVWICFL